VSTWGNTKSGKMHLSKCLELSHLLGYFLPADHGSLVEVVEELLVALDGLLVLLDLLVVELSLVDLVVLQAIQLLPLLQQSKSNRSSRLAGNGYLR